MVRVGEQGQAALSGDGNPRPDHLSYRLDSSGAELCGITRQIELHAKKLGRYDAAQV